MRYSIKLITFLLSLLLLSSAQAETLHFPINQFLIQGNTLVSNEAIAELTRPFTGDSRVYGDIQKALEAIENAYRKAGYGAVQVYAPEQDVTSGFVQLNVTESKLANIVTEFTEHFDRDSILASLPTLEIGKSPNTRAISNNIQLVNENPAKKIEVIMGAGDKEDTINATIKVREDNPVGIILTADNSGKPIAGEHKVGASIQHANLWGKEHIGTISYMTSPELSDKIKVISAGYRIPFFKTNSSLDLVVAKSDSDLTVASNLQSLGNINIIGRSTNLSARYTQHLPRTGEWSHRLIASLDNKLIDTQITMGTNTQGSLLQVRPIGITYSATRTSIGSMTNLSLGVSKNLPDNGDGSQERINSQLVTNNQRTSANADFTVLRASAEYFSAFLDSQWQVRLATNIQKADTALYAVEQLGLSGASSLRGMYERDLSADEGIASTAELYTPDLAGWLGKNKGNMRLLAFVDTVTGDNINPTLNSGTVAKVNATSIGVGARYNYETNLILRADYGNVTNLSLTNADGTSNSREAELSRFTRAHVSLIYKF